MTNLLTPRKLEAMCDELDTIDRDVIKTRIPRISVSQWAEQKRVLTREVTPRPGPFGWSITPFLREIADCLSETSPVREVVLMKPVQIGATTGLLENWIGYTIDASPSPMLFVTADAGMADTAIQLRVDAMINSAGLADKIRSQHRRKAQRKTGDIATRKEFPGGYLIAAGPKSGSKLRMTSFQQIAADEVDGFPQ